MGRAVHAVRDIVPTLEKAFRVAQEGVPGPVFVELPVDLLYDEPTVREMYGAKAATDIKSVPDLALQGYLRLHLARVFAGSARHRPQERIVPEPELPERGEVERALAMLKRASRPVLVLGSQAVLRVEQISSTIESSSACRCPVPVGHGAWPARSQASALVPPQPRRGTQGADLVCCWAYRVTSASVTAGRSRAGQAGGGQPQRARRAHEPAPRAGRRARSRVVFASACRGRQVSFRSTPS